MAYRQIHLTEKTLKKIAEALFLAYTAEQAAYLGGISERTLARIRKTEAWQKIEQKSLELERPYRQKIYRGEPGWQGAAWMLERKYPGHLSRPEIQLQVNTANTTTTNNTIVITAEQASNLRARNVALDSQLQKLVPPGSRSPVITPFMSGKEEQVNVSQKESLPHNFQSRETKTDSVILSDPAASPTGTPYARAIHIKPNLPPKSKSVVNSSNFSPKTTLKSVENSRNNKGIGEGGIKRGRGRPKKVALENGKKSS